MLYARNGVAEIVAARSDAANLTRTARAIARHIEAARADAARTHAEAARGLAARVGNERWVVAADGLPTGALAAD